MYKIFINDLPLSITSEAEKKLNAEEKNLRKIFEQLDTEKVSQLEFYSSEPESFLQGFYEFCKPISAAGGLVLNSKNQLLMIFRNGKWDLPKGKIDDGETSEIAAVREVEEECGFNDLKLESFFGKTFHTYRMRGVLYLKTTMWFKMSSNYEGEFIPQLEEDITKVEWFDLDKIDPENLNTYNSIKDLLKRFLSQN